ncbi:hypothetical protein BDEG_26676 [Batrachochytrium dendrobatidis JEL423]|nr:hypothetical protein BDEG_26676 [Batrachochytrium dendrobatidis JEL423]
MLIPGLMQVKEDFELLALALSSNSRVCVSDLRGMGKSMQCQPTPPSTTPPDITLLQLATDVFDIILALGWKSFILLGLGIGGTVAMHLALMLRGRDDITLQGLILVASCPMTPSRGRFFRSSLAMVQATGDNESITHHLAQEWIKTNLSSAFCKLPHMVTELVDRFMSNLRNPRIGEEQVFAMEGLNLTDQIGLVDVPTLILHGKNDAMIDSWYANVLNDMIPNSTMVLIPDAGHWVHVMAQTRLVAEIHRFMFALKLPSHL